MELPCYLSADKQYTQHDCLCAPEELLPTSKLIIPLGERSDSEKNQESLPKATLRRVSKTLNLAGRLLGWREGEETRFRRYAANPFYYYSPESPQPSLRARGSPQEARGPPQREGKATAAPCSAGRARTPTPQPSAMP